MCTYKIEKWISTVYFLLYKRYNNFRVINLEYNSKSTYFSTSHNITDFLENIFN